MRTTRCGVDTRCEKQSLTSAGDLGERLAGDQLAAQFARHRDRDVDRLGFHPGLDAGKALAMPLMAMPISSSASAVRRSLSALASRWAASKPSR